METPRNLPRQLAAWALAGALLFAGWVSMPAQANSPQGAGACACPCEAADMSCCSADTGTEREVPAVPVPEDSRSGRSAWMADSKPLLLACLSPASAAPPAPAPALPSPFRLPLFLRQRALLL